MRGARGIMDWLLLFVWTLPVAVLSSSSRQFLAILCLGGVAKTLQLCCLCCVSFAAALTSDSSISISGLHHDYVFVTPVEVDSSGSYISHDVLHSIRKKRSTQSSKSSLHYKFSAFGQELHLELKPSTIFSNNFIVQVLGEDGVTDSQEREVERCFYQGFIRNDNTSSVAISTCVGLVSVLLK
ncbi:ADAM metallopeptidase with thrombospondin type 1 motif 18 [Chelydra serpentina]|uniref:ADAM metallopeptidase with thrombospondin type 1 motif 18 n=1 Tax=Chelydra serpentina TaxID=8475 RepID=A0A8T1TGT7_CHESE|nr:ADAM metallopeptidase with thrombospondin type 1 motif 18 [Chelydra serpentina]